MTPANDNAPGRDLTALAIAGFFGGSLLAAPVVFIACLLRLGWI